MFEIIPVITFIIKQQVLSKFLTQQTFAVVAYVLLFIVLNSNGLLYGVSFMVFDQQAKQKFLKLFTCENRRIDPTSSNEVELRSR